MPLMRIMVILLYVLEEERGRHGERRPLLAADVVAEGAADRRPVHVDDLGVDAVVARVEGIEIEPGQVFIAVLEPGAVVAEDLRGRGIELELLRNREKSRLHVEARVMDAADRQ